MFDTSLVDVVIGLSFVFLLLSLLCTTITEWISRIVAMRAKTLEKGIRTLLHEDMQPPSIIGSIKSALTFARKDEPDVPQSGAWDGSVADFFSHPLVKGLYRPGPFDRHRRRPGKPSYIPPRAFAAAIVDLLVPADQQASDTANPSNPESAQGNAKDDANTRSARDDQLREAIEELEPEGLKRALLALLTKAENKEDKFRKELEHWFDDNMERVSGWYKRNVQVVLLFAAVVVVVLLNADSLAIGQELWNDQALRTSVADAAQQYIATHPTATPAPTSAASPTPTGTSTPEATATPTTELHENIAQVQQDLNSLQIPFGWQRRHGVSDPRELPKGWGWLTKVFGLGLTALALSLGAPFWFDLLGKLVNLRSTGDLPQTPGQATSGSGGAGGA